MRESIKNKVKIHVPETEPVKWRCVWALCLKLEARDPTTKRIIILNIYFPHTIFQVHLMTTTKTDDIAYF